MTGWTPDICECEHTAGDHQSGGGTNLWLGICLVEGCDCREFVLVKPTIPVTMCCRCDLAVHDCRCTPRYWGEPEPATKVVSVVIASSQDKS